MCSVPFARESQTIPVQEQARAARSSIATDLLLRALGGNKSPKLAGELAALGIQGAPFLLEVLTKGGVPVGVDPERPVVLEIPPTLQENVLTALASLPREPLLSLLRTSVASTDPAERATCLRVLGKIGTNEELDLLASLASPTASGGLVPPDMRTSFQESLVLILARDRKAFSQLTGFYTRLPPALISSMIRAAESEAPFRAVELLASLLGARVEADLFLLSEIARVADGHSVPTSRALRERIRRYLGESNLERLQAGVTAAGALEDFDAVPDLTRLLGHHETRVARGARTALKRIARKDLGRRPEAWTSWYQAESEWWSAKSAAISQDLSGRDRVKAAAAILELGSRRLRRDEAALLLAGGLQRPETDLVRTCCQALGHLRSSVAVPALEQAQNHQDPSVRESAGEALVSIREPKGGATAIRAAHKTP